MDPRKYLAVIIERRLRIRFFQHKPIQKLFLRIRSVKETVDPYLRVSQHHEHMPAVRNLMKSIYADVRIHKYFLAFRLRLLKEFIKDLKLHGLTFLFYVVEPGHIFIRRSADELAPVLQITGIGQIRELPAVELRQLHIVIVLLKRNPVMLSRKILHDG